MIPVIRTRSAAASPFRVPECGPNVARILLGAALANAVRKILTKGMDPETLERDLWRGGLVVFVRARAAEAEERAQAIMRRNGARNVHVHEIELKKTLDDLPLAHIQPDPWLD